MYVLNMDSGVHKVPFQVCWGRISSYEEGKGILGCGEEYNVEKGKAEAISSSP